MKLSFIHLIFACFFMSGCAYRGIAPEITTPHSFQRPIQPAVKKELIIVDAGHGGKDAGASSKRESYEEKELTLETALLIADYLKQNGYKTILTRTQDIFVPLVTRAEIANSLNADLFVSIHYNYSSSKDAKGIEVFYYKEEKKETPSFRIAQSKELGEEVLKKIVKSTGADSRGVKEANFAVVRQTKMPAILIEAGFLSNPRELEKIKDPQYKQSLAKGIANAVDQYLARHRK
jgi:N-acetylmuramoyl-L-alanine amidase